LTAVLAGQGRSSAESVSPPAALACGSRRNETHRVEETAELGAAGERQDLVDGEVGRVQTVPEVLIRLHGEEAEGGIVGPVEQEPVLPAAHFRPVKPYLAKRPLDRITRLAQCLLIRLRAGGDNLGRVVEDVEVVRIAKTGFRPVDHRPAGEMALGVAVRRQDAGDLPLKGG
jgi:hypothetical protein